MTNQTDNLSHTNQPFRPFFTPSILTTILICCLLPALTREFYSKFYHYNLSDTEVNSLLDPAFR